MTLLLFFVLLLLPLSSFAQSVPPMPHGGSITVIPNALGASYRSSHGGSVDVIGTEPGEQMYFSHDQFGQPNGMGYIHQPFAERPLTMPDISPSSHNDPVGDANKALLDYLNHR